MSGGLSLEQQREIERRGAYRAPRDATREPSAEQIARDFPRAFRCYSLTSGELAVTLSSYSGRDYSGRWGNFFAHTLVLDRDALDVLWSIDLYEWQGWKHQLGEEEDGESAPPRLPEIDLSAVVPAESFRLQELSQFLRSQPGGVAFLARLARALLASRSDSRPLVIRDEPVLGLFWVACLLKLFSPRHARSLSFSTYQDDPRSCFDVNSTTGETEFAFTPAEARYRFFLFDRKQGLESELPAAIDDYAETTALWLAEAPETLGRFHRFLTLFRHERIEPALAAALDLFRTSQDPETLPRGERLAAMVRFASEHSTEQGRLELMASLERAVLGAGQDLEPVRLAELCLFFAQGARASNRAAHREVALRTFQSLVERVLNRDPGATTSLEQAWAALREHLPGVERERARTLIDSAWARGQGGQLSRLSQPALEFLLDAVQESLALLGRGPSFEQSAFLLPARASITAHGVVGARAALRCVEGTPAELAGLALALAGEGSGPADREALGQALAELLAALPPSQASEARRQLEAAQGDELLLAEWSQLTSAATDPVGAFRRYQAEVLAALPAYARRSQAEIRRRLLTVLPGTEAQELACHWLETGELESCGRETVGICLSLANEAVALHPGRKSRARAELVADAALRLKVHLSPDRPRLQRILAGLEEEQAGLAAIDLRALSSDLVALRAEDYRQFVAAFMPSVLSRCGNAREHGRVVEACLRRDQLEAFLIAYEGFLGARRRQPWPEPLHIALRFWLSYDHRGEGPSELALVEKTAHRLVEQRLGRLGVDRLEQVDKSLRSARLSPLAERKWHQIRARATSRLSYRFRCAMSKALARVIPGLRR